MSHRVKNLTIEDGFVKNPDRVYYEEYFEHLPHPTYAFKIPATGNKDFTITQPANTFLKEAYVIGISGNNIILTASSNVGLSLSRTTQQIPGTEDPTNIIKGTLTNLLDGSNSTTTTLGGNNIIASFNNIISGINAYTSTSIQLYVRVTTSSVSSESSDFLNFVPVFASLNGTPVINTSYLVTGTGYPSVTYDSSSGYSGLKLTTSATASDQALVHTINNTTFNALSSGVLLPDARIEFETSIIIPDITTVDFGVIAGLKISNPTTLTTTIATDNDKAMFIFGATAAFSTTALSSNANILFVYSVGGSDYITDTGLAVVANREYHLKIKINKHKKISIFINGVQYGLTATSGVNNSSKYGDTATNSYDESVAMHNASLYPVAGIQITSTVARSLIVNYIKCSCDSKKVDMAV